MKRNNLYAKTRLVKRVETVISYPVNVPRGNSFMVIGLIILVFASLILWYWQEKKQRVSHPVQGGINKSVTLQHDAEFELYHNALSLCSKKARICLDELGIPYKSHHIHLIETGYYETISRHFLKVNPAGVLPVLVHNGHPIYESHDIINYAAAHSQTPELLIPIDDSVREIMDYWSDKASVVGEDTRPGMAQRAGNCVTVLTVPLFASGMTTIPLRYVVIGLLFHRLKIRPLMFTAFKLLGPAGALRIPKFISEISVARDYMHKHLDELERHLETTGPWIAGEQFTLADVSWMSLIERFREADWLDYFLKDRPQLSAYWGRLSSRESYRTAITECSHPTIEIANALLRLTKMKYGGIKNTLEANRSI